MAYRDNEIGLQVGKINPLSDIQNIGIPTTGNVVFVKNPSDADYTTVKEAVGASFMFDTPQAAINSPKVRNGKNDYVLVCPRDTGIAWVPTDNGTASIVLNKANVHLLGLGQRNAFGSNAVIVELPGTAGTIGTFGGLFVTANGCEVGGFFFRGTAGTSSGGSVGAGTLDGAQLGGLITIGTTVQGLDLHDFKVQRTAAQWDGGTSGANGTPVAMVDIGSGCQDITIRNGFIDGGSQLKSVYGIRLPFNGQNIVVNDTTILVDGIAAASNCVRTQGGTIPLGMYYQLNRVAMVNTNAGTTMAASIGGTMPVGALAFVNESPSAGNITSTGTAGSCYVMPVQGTATVVRNPYIGVGTAAITSA